MSLARLFMRPQLAQPRGLSLIRSFSSLESNPHIKAFRLATLPPSYLLTYLDTNPPSEAAAIGVTTELPPTPQSFRSNPRFLEILNATLKIYAREDEYLKSQAVAFAAPGGSLFGISNAGSGGTGGASYQGGSGGAGMGGWVHLSDLRNPPDYGRIAWPEDILGSVEVDNQGQLFDSFQPSGTYRIVTNQGILGLGDFVREKLVEALREEERNDTSERPHILD